MRSKEEIGKALADRLRRAREHAGLSHARLSAASGVSEYHLIKLERDTSSIAQTEKKTEKLRAASAKAPA